MSLKRAKLSLNTSPLISTRSRLRSTTGAPAKDRIGTSPAHRRLSPPRREPAAVGSPRNPRRTFHGLLLRLAARPDDLPELHRSGDGTGQLHAVHADPVRSSVPARDAGHVGFGHPHMRGGRLRVRVCNSFRVTTRGGAATPRGDLSGGRQL